MKKGVLNYSITWNQDGEKHEEVIFTKIATVQRYIDLLFSDRDSRLSGKRSGISSLTVWEIYTTTPTKPAKDITGIINRFLA